MWQFEDEHKQQIIFLFPKLTLRVVVLLFWLISNSHISDWEEQQK